MNIRVTIANLLWFAYSWFRSLTWKKATLRVEATQAELLREIVKRNAGSKFGEEHSFAVIGSVADFQEAVPVRSYEEFQPYIDSIAAGEKAVLTADPVQRFGITSGSTRASKLVPYTAQLIAEFQAGVDPWMARVMRDYPRLMRGKAYWSVTPVGTRERRTKGGIPIGFDDERSYFGKLTQWVLGNVMAAPSELALIEDMEAFRYATLRFLLAEKSLTWISIWNPTFLTLLLQPLPEFFDRLVEDIRNGTMSVDLKVSPEIDASIRTKLTRSPKRAAELSRIPREGNRYLYREIWPNLVLISCWAHGNSQEAAIQLQGRFPSVLIQPKGLIATESFVSFPFFGEWSAVSITSHFFEFEEEGSAIKLAHELESGKKYSVIVTTSGGLYRYRLHDTVEVMGHENECPLIRFIGKADKVVDICGEKLNEEFAASAVRNSLVRHNLHPTFWMVAPETSGEAAKYTLFAQFPAGVEASVLEKLGRDIDAALRESFHYDYCRRLGQLGRLEVFLIEKEDASAMYLTTCVGLGQRLGDIKSVALHPFRDWSQKFQGRFITALSD